MSWADKALRKARVEREVKEVMNSQMFKEHMKQQNIAVFIHFCLITVDFLFRQEGYKAKRVKRFLEFVREQLDYVVAEGDDYFLPLNEALKDDTGVDVLEYLGFEIKE